MESSKTSLTCPDCGGSLEKLQSGDMLQYRCRVGHAYSADSARTAHTAREERQKIVRAEFIQVELDLAITFCQIALSTGDREKIERNEGHAQEAHDSALRFLDTSKIGEPLKKNLEEKLEHLQKLLDEVKKKRSANARAL